MDFTTLINNRHSTRKYSAEKISEEKLNSILEAAKLAPSSRNKKPVECALITDTEILEKLSYAKAAGSSFIKDADAAIVVYADSEKSDVWIEDASIVMTYLHLAAENENTGSCWIQLRNRQTSEKTDSALYVKKLLNLESRFQVLAMLALGNKTE